MIYHVVLFIHLIAVFASFAAATLEFVAIRRMRQASTAGQVLEWSWLHAPVEKLHRIAGPLLLVTGLILEYLTWGWMQAWINVSIVALIAIAVCGATQNAPRFRAIHEAALASASPLAMPPDLTAKLASPAPLIITGTLVGTALGVTFTMVAKQSWVPSLLAVLIGAGCGYASQKFGKRAAHPVSAQSAAND